MTHLIALGAVIRGETPHFDYVAGEAARGLQQVALRDRIAGGVWGADDRYSGASGSPSGGNAGNKGFDAAMTAIEMARSATRSSAAVPSVMPARHRSRATRPAGFVFVGSAETGHRRGDFRLLRNAGFGGRTTRSRPSRTSSWRRWFAVPSEKAPDRQANRREIRTLAHRSGCPRWTAISCGWPFTK